MIVKQLNKNRRQGHTLAELMVAMGIGTIVMGAAGLITLQSGVEQKAGLAKSSLMARADTIEDRLITLLRGYSASESVAFGNPVKDGHNNIIGYRRIIVAKGPIVNHPREEFLFNPDTGALTHDTNLASTSDSPTDIHQNRPGLMLEDLYFFPSIEPDGSEKRSQLNIIMTIRDNGWSGARSGGQPVENIYRRTFTVTMRNN